MKGELDQLELQKCALCDRLSDKNGVYCFLHGESLSQIREKFMRWQEAFGEMSWERYLERIIELKETGDQAKEVARHLLNQELGRDFVGSR